MSQSDLLNNWKTRAAAAPPAFPRRPAGVPARASNGQRRLFLLQQLYPENRFYQYAHGYDLHGPLDKDLLMESLAWVVDRHESLRTNFVADNDAVRLIIHPPGQVDRTAKLLTYYAAPAAGAQRALAASDAPPLPGSGAGGEAYVGEEVPQLETRFTHHPFDLEKAPLLRVLLRRLGPTHHRLVLCIHHIIGDRGSLKLLEEEWFSHYAKLVTGATDDRPAPAVQFSDFAYREATREVAEAHYEYWRKQLAGELPLAALPYDRARPAAPSFRGALVQTQLPATVSHRIRRLARRHETTANVVFVALYNAFLYRYTGQSDVLVGSPVSIRDHRAAERLIGFLNETVVLRQSVNGRANLEELVAATHQTMEDALANKDVPFNWLIEELQPERRGGVSPFFQTMLVYNAPGSDPLLPPDLTITDEYLDLGTAKFDLTVFVSDLGNRFQLGLEYASDLFDRATIEAMLERFELLLTDLTGQPDSALAKARLLTGADRKLLLEDWNPTFPLPEDEPAPPLLTELFDTTLSPGCSNAAVTSARHSLTRHQLHQRSLRLAHRLLQTGLPPGTAVGLYCGRTPDLLVGILGILRAGGAYVPLDPEYPQERFNYIVADSGVATVVHPAELTPPLVPNVTGVALPQPSADGLENDFPDIDLPIVDRQQNAYLIYTSGSTGRPKGIAITHDNLARSTDARLRFFDRQPEAFLLLSSFSFDSSVAGISWCLATGAELILSARRAEQDPAGLGRLIREHGVTHTLMLPSLYQLVLEFAEPEDLTPLATVIVAGEACPAALVDHHFSALPNTRLVNEYGPTEGTVWSTAHRIEPDDARNGVPIGRPVYGMGHFVLDDNQQLLPPGLAGELCLSGRQLAAGYHGRPELTAASFIPNPFFPGQRLYRTGDVVRYRNDGVVNFLGRRDEQVKIRGHRIELAEISNVLTGLAEVREAVTLAREYDGETRLVSYFLPEQNADGPSTDELTLHLLNVLRERLPEYMIPTSLLALNKIPRLPNGKIDRRKLPEREWRVIDHSAYAPPQGETEEMLAALWGKVLQLDRVGRHDNFFGIGGDSLKSIRIIAGAAKAGLKLAPHHLFNHQTVAELADVLTAPSSSHRTGVPAPDDDYEPAVLLRKGGAETPLFCLHSGGGHVFFYQQLARKLDGTRSVYALQPKGLSGETDLPRSMQEMAADYITAIKSVQPDGPYLLLGTCFSNALAVEMAHQLRAAGDDVLPLLIIDSGTGTFMRPEAEFDTGSKLTNLLKMVREGRWDKIARRFRVRIILGYREVAGRLDEQRRHLYGTIGALNDLYTAYEWPAHPGKVVLIRSSEFAGRRDKDYHVVCWRALANAVETHTVPGKHLTIFQEPAVSGLAAKIDECLR